MSSQEERMMILQMVAEQKITAAEGAELLKALDQKDEGSVLEEEEPNASRSAQQGAGLGAGIGSLLEDVVGRVSSAVTSVVGSRHQFTNSFTGTFAEEEIPLHITVGNGRVEVEAWDEPGYRADVVVRVRGSNTEEAKARARKAYTITADEHRFTLEGTRTSPWDQVVNVTLKVPRERRYRAEICTDNGELLLTNLELAQGQLQTGNGRIACRGVQADQLVIKSGNGNVEMEGEAGELDVQTGNGSVLLRPSGERSQALRISTGNGPIRMFTSRLEPEMGLQLDACTGMGNITLSLPDLIYDRNDTSPANRHVVAKTARFDQGTPHLTLTARTGMGAITVE